MIAKSLKEVEVQKVCISKWEVRVLVHKKYCCHYCHLECKAAQRCQIVWWSCWIWNVFCVYNFVKPVSLKNRLQGKQCVPWLVRWILGKLIGLGWGLRLACMSDVSWWSFESWRQVTAGKKKLIYLVWKTRLRQEVVCVTFDMPFRVVCRLRPAQWWYEAV